MDEGTKVTNDGQLTPVNEFAETIIGHHIEKVLYAKLMDVIDLVVEEPTKGHTVKRIVKSALRDLTADMRHIANTY